MFLADTKGLVNYGGDIEKIRASFRLCFSVFDSLAMLMNMYFKSNLKQVSFSPRCLRKILPPSDNPFLSSLYWLSCDLQDVDPSKAGVKWQAPNPPQAAIKKIRNACEHGWLRVSDGNNIEFEAGNDFAYIITSGELKSKTLEVLKLARSALGYFCLAVKYEEMRRDDSNSVAISQQTPLIDSLMML